jgi:hypothetical protein
MVEAEQIVATLSGPGVEGLVGEEVKLVSAGVSVAGRVVVDGGVHKVVGGAVVQPVRVADVRQVRVYDVHGVVVPKVVVRRVEFVVSDAVVAGVDVVTSNVGVGEVSEDDDVSGV